jgi:hypothetical protein
MKTTMAVPFIGLEMLALRGDRLRDGRGRRRGGRRRGRRRGGHRLCDAQGALLGTGVGATAGAIYHITKT